MAVVRNHIEVEVETAFEFIAFEGIHNESGGIAVHVLAGVVFVLPDGIVGRYGNGAGEGQIRHGGHFVEAFGVLGLDEDFSVGFRHFVGLTVGITEIVGGGVGREIVLIDFLTDAGRDGDFIVVLGLEGIGERSERGSVFLCAHEEINKAVGGIAFCGTVIAEFFSVEVEDGDSDGGFIIDGGVLRSIIACVSHSRRDKARDNEKKQENFIFHGFSPFYSIF